MSMNESKRKIIIEQLIKKGLVDANDEQITTKKLSTEIEESLDRLYKENMDKENKIQDLVMEIVLKEQGIEMIS